MAAELEYFVDDIHDDTALQDIRNMDSLLTSEIIMATEDEYEKEIPGEIEERIKPEMTVKEFIETIIEYL